MLGEWAQAGYRDGGEGESLKERKGKGMGSEGGNVRLWGM